MLEAELSDIRRRIRLRLWSSFGAWRSRDTPPPTRLLGSFVGARELDRIRALEVSTGAKRHALHSYRRKAEREGEED